jgi:hypothetical protein
MIHVATEVTIIGGLAFLFSKKVNEMGNRVIELEKKVIELTQKLDSIDPTSSNSVSMDQFAIYQENVKQQFKAFAGAIVSSRQPAPTPSHPPLFHNHSPMPSSAVPMAHPIAFSFGPPADRPQVIRNPFDKPPSVADSFIPRKDEGLPREQKEIVIVQIKDEDLDKELADEYQDLSPSEEESTSITIEDEIPTEEVKPVEVIKVKKTVKKKK